MRIDLNEIFLRERQRFLITDNVPDGFLSKFDEINYEVDYYPLLTNDMLHEIIHHYEGIVMSSFITLDEPTLKKAQKLKYILRPGSGLDNVDVDYAKKQNIVVLNSPEANKDAVGEHAIGLLLSLLNNIPRAINEVSDFRWERELNKGVEIKGKTIGIIGFGNTGSSIAHKLSGFEAELLTYDKYLSETNLDFVKMVSLETIFDKADIITLHIPLTSETFHYLNDEFIERFRKNIYIINTARGKIVDSNALLRGLTSGKILGAALDVLENENFQSIPEQEKSIISSLLETKKVIITPHIAGWTKEAREKIFYLVLQKFQHYLDTLQTKSSGEDYIYT